MVCPVMANEGQPMPVLGMEAIMGWKIGGTFCECTQCGRQFMGPYEMAIYGHMIRDHGLCPEEALRRTTESIHHNVTEEYFVIPGIG